MEQCPRSSELAGPSHHLSTSKKLQRGNLLHWCHGSGLVCIEVNGIQRVASGFGPFGATNFQKEKKSFYNMTGNIKWWSLICVLHRKLEDGRRIKSPQNKFSSPDIVPEFLIFCITSYGRNFVGIRQKLLLSMLVLLTYYLPAFAHTNVPKK